ncbi:hypothetical protein N5P18_08480 [Janibacter terrae]|jgi:hypothetical protein|uniref:Uncharacterized protein n=1 Tax=Janibacter terrae TaxID=103817 RepID=A0ABZ2F907_9MICO|nr:hypothetical protein [Janibacter terrae]MBA4084524.1 hypothetical protein [Kytococcus sp.]HBO53962.1 hypothetical protein [Janibacter terrae]HCE61171.1 hypothetical protein [Janibacter terrae]
MSQQADGGDEGGQVSETSNLRDTDVDEAYQQSEGVPPSADAPQEDQSAKEAEVSPEHGDVDESVDHGVGRDTE